MEKGFLQDIGNIKTKVGMLDKHDIPKEKEIEVKEQLKKMFEQNKKDINQ